MNYLVELLDHLDGDELSQLRELKTPLRERQLLDHLIKHPGIERESVLASLDISGSHFDKLSSTLLTKSYQLFAPNGLADLFDFLRPKGLWVHLEHEFKKEEKRVKKEPDLLSSFYLRSLRQLALYTYEKRYVDLVEHCMTQLLKLEPSAENRSIIGSIRTQIEFHYSRSASLPLDEQDAIRERVLSLHDVAFATNDALARHYQLNAEGYTNLLSDGGEKAVELFRQALLDIEAHRLVFLPSEHARTIAQLAEALYYSDQLDEAAKIYQTLFEGSSRAITSPHYHAVKYAQILIVFGRFEEAESLLFKWFPRSIIKSNDRRSSAGAITLAKLYLTWGKFEEAQEFIEISRETNIKAQVIPYEVQIRLLELLHAYSQGQYLEAYELIEKTIRYGREKNMFISATQLPPMMQATRLLTKEKIEPGTQMDEFETITTEVMRNYNRHVARLLIYLRERATTTAKTKMAAM